MPYHKNISYRRNERAKHIARRKAICNAHQVYATIPIKGSSWSRIDASRKVPEEWYTVDGMYDKGKIHCGCPLCKPGKRQHVPSSKEAKEVKLAMLAEQEFWIDEGNVAER